MTDWDIITLRYIQIYNASYMSIWKWIWSAYDLGLGINWQCWNWHGNHRG